MDDPYPFYLGHYTFVTFRVDDHYPLLIFFIGYRFTQAGSEVSALLGRIPSAVGYQPTLATDMGSMQERITTTLKGSITSVQVTSRANKLSTV